MSSIVSWKDKSLTQIVASIQKNTNTSTIDKYNIRNAPPLKIYRKEISEPSNKSSRLGVTIRSFDMPNGTTKTNVNVGNSLVIFQNEKDVNITNKKIDSSDGCITLCNSTPQQNARNRTRTSGIISKNYSTDTKQYLKKRGMSIEQNQFNYVRNQVAGIPGQISECKMNEVIYKPSNNEFACDGGVSSSSLILRKKYNTITTNANKYLSSYGPSVSNAMQYGISDSIFTYKNKFAFPIKKTPISKKNTDTMQFCERNKFDR